MACWWVVSLSEKRGGWWVLFAIRKLWLRTKHRLLVPSTRQEQAVGVKSAGDVSTNTHDRRNSHTGHTRQHPGGNPPVAHTSLRWFGQKVVRKEKQAWLEKHTPPAPEKKSKGNYPSTFGREGLVPPQRVSSCAQNLNTPGISYEGEKSGNWNPGMRTLGPPKFENNWKFTDENWSSCNINANFGTAVIPTA